MTTPPTPAELQMIDAAKAMLAISDGFMDGKTGYDNAAARRLFRASSFGAQAFAICPVPDARASAMLRAFLVALIDPAQPDLDYLRAKNMMRVVESIDEVAPNA